MALETTVIPLMRQVIYSTYASFPTAGLRMGDLAWATDRKCLYRWSGSAWETIGISSRHGNYTDRGTASDYPESSLYQADDQGLLYMVVSAAWQQITYAAGLPAWAVGDNTVINAPTEKSTSSTTYVKLKEICIATGGTIRVAFDIKTGGQTAYARVYKNGSAYGTEQSHNTSAYVTKTEDLSFVTNDLIQVYAKTATNTVYIANFKLKADKLHTHMVYID